MAQPMDDMKIHVVTYNVATLFPNMRTNLTGLLGLEDNTKQASHPDIYVVGCQEVKSQPQNYVYDTLLTIHGRRCSNFVADFRSSYQLLQPMGTTFKPQLRKTLAKEFNGITSWPQQLKCTEPQQILESLTLAPRGYVKLRTIRLQGIVLSVYVLRRHVVHVREVEDKYVRLGFGGMWGNKGAVALRLSLNGVSLCLVNCHLAAHDHLLAERIQNYTDILSQANFQHPATPKLLYHDTLQSRRTSAASAQTIFPVTPCCGPLLALRPVRPEACSHMSHRATADSYLIWLGDMNFRLSSGEGGAPDDEAARRLADEHQLTPLLELDQLRWARRTGNAFSELSEPTLTFKPTYKLVPGRRGLYATSRRPAWTDRILYKVNADVYEETRLTMEPLSYQSHPEYTVSDHQPVSAEFRVKVFSGRPLPCVEFLPISMWLVGSDCVAKYRCDRALEISAWDWIALFRANFASLDEYISYIWAPRTTSSPNSDHYVAVFPEDSVTVPGSYVLVYFGRNGRGVYGISEPFAVQYSHTARLAALAIGRTTRAERAPLLAADEAPLLAADPVEQRPLLADDPVEQRPPLVADPVEQRPPLAADPVESPLAGDLARRGPASGGVPPAGGAGLGACAAARHGATLAAACHSQPAKMKSNGVVMVLLAEVVFRAAPETAVSPIPGLPSAVSGEQASAKPIPMVMLVHLILLTRLLMVKLVPFDQLLATAAADNDGSGANIFKRPRNNTGSGEILDGVSLPALTVCHCNKVKKEAVERMSQPGVTLLDWCVLVFSDNGSFGPQEHDGWTLFLHEPGLVFTDYTMFYGMTAPVRLFANSVITVRVMTKVFNRLPGLSGCTQQPIGSVQVCLERCVNKKAGIGEPSCRIPWIPASAGRPPCTTYQQFVNASGLDTLGSFDESAMAAATRGCPCHLNDIQTKLTLLMDTTLQTTEEVEVYPLDQFLSDVGGSLGLMIGGSLLTIVELVDCLVCSCCGARRRA
ncbi:uncharacterized protein LOC119109932 [Pollicipes pollicipes]|uniref:uncharacterized protein LOC119109932 n=1 Tax=Pollicipes pollicipes TaxID=41117 RepID=UPI0018859FD2|nr:uncharacterized protein LOC119109932 [Pollicipes pollicipes]